MTDFGARLNSLIDLAAGRPDFTKLVESNFEDEAASLAASLQDRSLFFTTSVLGMEAVSHVIEDQAINLGGQFRFFSAFQKFSRFRAQEERYRQLTGTGNQIFVFGVPDITLPAIPNLHLVELPDKAGPGNSALSNFWFVVLHNPEFVSMALVCREIPPLTGRPAGAPSKLIYRNFEGFWTYDKQVIQALIQILDDYLNRFYFRDAVLT